MTGRGYPVPAGGTGAPTARTGRYSESSCGCPSHCTGVTVPGRAAARATGTEPEATPRLPLGLRVGPGLRPGNGTPAKFESQLFPWQSPGLVTQA